MQAIRVLRSVAFLLSSLAVALAFAQTPRPH